MIATTFEPARLKGLAKTSPTKCPGCLRPTPPDELIRHGGECIGCEGDREVHSMMLDTDY